MPVPVAAALARAAATVGRLDQAAATHPLRPALLHRLRLDAVRRAAGTDGHAVDPWHLAAVLAGLRPRLDRSLSTGEAGGIFDAARLALAHHRWLTAPDVDEEAEVRAVLAVLREGGGMATNIPLLDAAAGARAWIAGGGARPPLRAALVRFWEETGTTSAPLPLLGTAAFGAEAAWNPASVWTVTFLDALAAEAVRALDLLVDLEPAWHAARRAAAAGRRRHSRAPAAADVLAAAPLASAATVAAALGVAPKNALAILAALVRDGVAVEVSRRAARRLWGLRGMAPLAEVVAPPRRPEPGRRRGRPRKEMEAPAFEAPPPPLPPFTPAERRTFDYTELEAAIAAVDAAMRGTSGGTVALGWGKGA